MGYDIKGHLAKAKSLCQLGDVTSLRYCALELRLAIESHVYNQLKASLGNLPESVVNKWQPPQAIKTLCMFEETADMNLYVEITGEGIPPIKAEYNNIKYKDLSKMYNSLGSYLHQATIKKQEVIIEKSKLEEILLTLMRLSETNLITFSRGYETIDCEKCKKAIMFTKNYLEKYNRLDCQSSGCNNYAIVRIALDGTTESFQSAQIPCFNCGERYSMSLCDIDAESGFVCKACNNKHEIKKFIYSLGKVTPVPNFSFESEELQLKDSRIKNAR